MWEKRSAEDAAKKPKAGEATPLKGEPSSAAAESYGGHVGLIGATAILSTFSTTSSNVMYPQTYGVLGTMLGPLLGITIQGFMCVVAMLVVRIAVRLQCRTLSDLGYVLGGVWGRRILAFFQQLNNALFMPVALVFSADSLRQTVLVSSGCTTQSETGEKLSLAGVSGSCAFWDCNVNSLLIVALLAWPVLVLARDIGELTWNAFVSIMLIFVQTGALFWAVTYSRPGGNDAYVMQPYALAGSATPVAWYTVASAIGTYLYSFCPLFIAVEVAASMARPDQIATAVFASFCLNVAVYVLTGLVVVDHWGSGLPSPVTEVVVGWPAVVTNLVLFYCTFLDFAIVGSVLNRELQRVWMPSFDRQFTMRSLPTWALLTLPSLTFALGMSILTPRLDTLAGFLESLCVPTVMLMAVPAMLLLLRARRDELLLDKGASKQVTALDVADGWSAGLAAALALGLALLVTIFSETIYSIFYETNYDLSGNYFCDVVAT